jgi:actin-related protein
VKQPKKISASEKQKLIEMQIKIAPHLSSRQISKQLAVSHVTVEKYKQKLLKTGQLSIVDTPLPEYLSHPYFVKNRNVILEELDARGLRALKAPGVIQLMEERQSLSPRACQAILNRQIKAARRKNTSDKIPEVDIRCLDLINDDMSWVQDSSVDLILTDLPYSSAYIDVYKALSHLAGRVLKKDGIASLVCMTGYGALPQVLDALREDPRLRYNWTITTIFPRRSSNLGWIGVSSFAKPVIHMTCEKAYKGEIYSDLITAEPANKTREIEWEQPLDVFQKLASVFLQHGDSVLLDPCCGSSTSLLAGLLTGCCAKILGTDISAECVKISKKRIMNYLDNKDISD